MADFIPTRGRHLNHVAWLYDPLVEKMSFGRERRFRQKTLELMDFPPEAEILDVGCGTGSLTLLVAQHLGPAGAIVGIDAAPRMIAIAAKKAKKAGNPARFQVGVAEGLDFQDASFDLVVNSMFTHHLDTGLKKMVFLEMFRVLRPGGMLVTADIDRPTTLAAKMLGWTSRYILLQKELEDNLLGDLPAMMAEAGFTDIQRRAHLYGLVSFFTARKPGGAP